VSARVYLILICCAARGETGTYEELAQRAHQQNKALLTPPLDLIAGRANALPALTLLVVGRVTGEPAPSFEAAGKKNASAEQDKVRDYDGSRSFPPALQSSPRLSKAA
jgi:hypothetical protein